MTMSLVFQRRIAVAAMLSGTAAMLAGVVAWAALDSGSEEAASQQRAPVDPPAFNRWISPESGRFFVFPYDDRELGDEQRAANPVYDPRWEPFAACVEAKGVAARESSSSSRFSQADLDALLERVNRERPDAKANLKLNKGAKLPGVAGAFLACADEWLALSNEELEARGFRSESSP